MCMPAAGAPCVSAALPASAVPISAAPGVELVAAAPPGCVASFTQMALPGAGSLGPSDGVTGPVQHRKQQQHEASYHAD